MLYKTLASVLDAAGISSRAHSADLSFRAKDALARNDKSAIGDGKRSVCLAATATALPIHRQPASAINALLHRPPGWLEEHAGIESRCIWGEEDPLDAAVRAAQQVMVPSGFVILFSAPTARPARCCTSRWGPAGEWNCI